MRTKGDHILLVLNRGFGGFSAFGKGCYEWAKETVEELRKYTQRPILIRSHNHAKITPELAEDKKNLDYILKTYDNIKHTAFGESDLVENLKNAWACVCYTSTSGAVALIEGVPLFTTHQACFSKMYSSGQLEDIENPKEVDREKFLADYATAHWSLDEMKDGTFWRKFKKYYIKKMIIGFETGKSFNDRIVHGFVSKLDGGGYETYMKKHAQDQFNDKNIVYKNPLPKDIDHRWHALEEFGNPQLPTSAYAFWGFFKKYKEDISKSNKREDRFLLL